EVLHQAHERGLPHLDLKPANVLVSRAGGQKLRTTLTDLGMARAYDNLGLGSLTRTGDVPASLPFMAPELVLDCRFDRPSADVYSVGATLYHLLSGSTPHVFAAGRDPYRTVLEQDAFPLRERCPWLSRALTDLVHKALA